MANLTLRPSLNSIEQIAHAKPTQVAIGVFYGFSMPVYAADNEELFISQIVPGRWDGVSDIEIHVFCCLGGVEDVGDNFKFQLSWEHAVDENVVPATTHDVQVEQAVLAGRAAQYDLYVLCFTIDYDADGVGNEIQPHEVLGMRLYRIDATNPDVTNEIIVLDWHDHYEVDKMFIP